MKSAPGQIGWGLLLLCQVICVGNESQRQELIFSLQNSFVIICLEKVVYLKVNGIEQKSAEENNIKHLYDTAFWLSSLTSHCILNPTRHEKIHAPDHRIPYVASLLSECTGVNRQSKS